MDWHRLGRGPYSGKTLPEIMFHLQDPDYVLDGLEKGEFGGPVRDEALELCRRAAHIRLDPDVVVYYRVADGSYAGLAMAPRASPERRECERGATACTEGYFDLTVLKRLAPRDKLATLRLMQAFEYHCLDEGTSLARFFDDASHFGLSQPPGRRAA